MRYHQSNPAGTLAKWERQRRSLFGSERDGSSSGFALLLTLVVVSVVGVVAFGIGRLSLVELRQTVRFQDSQSALEAAEAGIENGLLLYRLDHDSQLPVKSQCSDPTYGDPTKDTPYVLRVNLTTQETSEKVQCIDATKAPPPPKPDIVYDLKMYFKGKELGTCGTATPTKSCGVELKQDEKTSIVVDEVPSIALKASLSNANTQPLGGLGFSHAFEIKFFDDQGQQMGQPIFIDETRDTFLKSNRGFPIVIANNTNTIQIRPLETDSIIAASVPTGSSSSSNIDFGFSFIEATGYSNGVKRRLTSTINRSSGQTRGVYDFVLFGGASAISAP